MATFAKCPLKVKSMMDQRYWARTIYRQDHPKAVYCSWKRIMYLWTPLSPSCESTFVCRWIWHPAVSVSGGSWADKDNNFLRAIQEVLNKPSHRINMQGLTQFLHLMGLTRHTGKVVNNKKYKSELHYCCQVLADLQRISRLQGSASKATEPQSLLDKGCPKTQRCCSPENLQTVFVFLCKYHALLLIFVKGPCCCCVKVLNVWHLI